MLFPTIVGYNELLIRTDEKSPYKVLVSVYQVTYGKHATISQPETSADQPTPLQPMSVR